MMDRNPVYMAFRRALQFRVRDLEPQAFQKAILQYLNFLFDVYDLEPDTLPEEGTLPISLFLHLLSCVDEHTFSILKGIVEDEEMVGVQRLNFVADQKPYLIRKAFDFPRHGPLLKILARNRTGWGRWIAATYISFLNHLLKRSDERDFVQDLLSRQEGDTLWMVPVQHTKSGNPDKIVLGENTDRVLELAGVEAFTFWQMLLIRLKQGYSLTLTARLVSCMPRMIQAHIVDWLCSDASALHTFWSRQDAEGGKLLSSLVKKYRDSKHHIPTNLTDVAKWVLHPGGEVILFFEEEKIQQVMRMLIAQRYTMWFFERWWNTSVDRAITRVSSLL